jgi:initiation factor 1A
MVKNSTGGNKSKKQGRKYATASLLEQGQQQNVRRAEEKGEIYAAITKIFGGSSCKVICVDGNNRDCIIRHKFTSAGGKRQNMLSIGTWVLVGIRSWEVRLKGDQKCDLLEVYTSNEKDRLKQIENNFNFKYLNIASDVSTTNRGGMDEKKDNNNDEDEDYSLTFSNSAVATSEAQIKTTAIVEHARAADSSAADSSAADSSAADTSDSDASTNSSTNSNTKSDKKDIITNIKKHNDWMIDENDI